MTHEERLKVGIPLMTLVGTCQAAESLAAESNIKEFARLLVLRANEMQAIWDEINKPGRE